MKGSAGCCSVTGHTTAVTGSRGDQDGTHSSTSGLCFEVSFTGKSWQWYCIYTHISSPFNLSSTPSAVQMIALCQTPKDRGRFPFESLYSSPSEDLAEPRVEMPVRRLGQVAVCRKASLVGADLRPWHRDSVGAGQKVSLVHRLCLVRSPDLGFLPAPMLEGPLSTGTRSPPH